MQGAVGSDGRAPCFRLPSVLRRGPGSGEEGYTRLPSQCWVQWAPRKFCPSFRVLVAVYLLDDATSHRSSWSPGKLYSSQDACAAHPCRRYCRRYRVRLSRLRFDPVSNATTPKDAASLREDGLLIGGRSRFSAPAPRCLALRALLEETAGRCPICEIYDGTGMEGMHSDLYPGLPLLVGGRFKRSASSTSRCVQAGSGLGTRPLNLGFPPGCYTRPIPDSLGRELCWSVFELGVNVVCRSAWVSVKGKVCWDLSWKDGGLGSVPASAIDGQPCHLAARTREHIEEESCG